MPEHVPVLLSPVLERLNLHSPDTVIDATLGGGGHTRAMLDAVAPDGRVLGIEADPRTLRLTGELLKSYGRRFIPAHGNFRDLRAIAERQKFHHVDAVLFDLGLSSMTIGDATRGFSFQMDGPLDMRFDPTTQTMTAADLITETPHEALAALLREYGQEPLAGPIAERLKQRAPYHTTRQLADDIAQVKRRRGKIHPATQTFQALRIAVNDEYGALQAALPQALDVLVPGGRLAVISFHSGEDRIVKYWMKSLPEHVATIVTKHVIAPNRAEQLSNPRSRSAKLRILIKN